MSYDELELDKLGDEKSALFFLISDTDTTYNFLVALAFSQMFNLLCERADNTYGGRLPYHVRVLWDEAANTGQVPGLEKIVAVIRSREISLTLFYQSIKLEVEVHIRYLFYHIFGISTLQTCIQPAFSAPCTSLFRKRAGDYVFFTKTIHSPAQKSFF